MELSLQDISMSATSEMFRQPTSKDSTKCTSLPESASGATPSGRPDGTTVERSGRRLVHANLSPRQAADAGLLTSGTYGRRPIISSSSEVLTLLLANKFKAETASLGSTLYGMTWKDLVLPSARSISLLRASARRTSANGFYWMGHSALCRLGTFDGYAEEGVSSQCEPGRSGLSRNLADAFGEQQRSPATRRQTRPGAGLREELAA
jgi:hypothetical protein